MIKVQHLVREYVTTQGFLKRTSICKRAVDDISFHVNKGEIFSILGPNGAGKTTTIKVLSTLLAPTSGQVTILNMDVYKDAKALRSQINFIFGGESGVYRRISGKENLRYFASLYHIRKEKALPLIAQLLKLVKLEDAQDQKVEEYSKGMIQRLQIARGLLNDPSVIYLDEPTLGLDPVGARDLRFLLLDLKKRGKTIILTTHDMEEADFLSDRIAMIKGGKIIAMDTPENLKKQVHSEEILEIQLHTIQIGIVEKIQKHASVLFVHTVQNEQGIQLQIQYQNDKNLIAEILAILNPHDICSIQQKRIGLSDMYIRMM